MTSHGRLVVDASVAIKWYVPEDRSADAARILANGDELLAPDLLVAEFGNVLWKKVRRGELTTAEATDIVEAFLLTAPIVLHDSSSLLRGAFDLAVRFQRSAYDSLYLALAVAENCQLVTADERMENVLQGTSLQPFVTSLLKV